MNPSAAPAGERRERLGRFIDRFVAELAPLSAEHNLAVWDANITGDPARLADGERLDNRIRGIFARPEPYAELRRLEQDGGTGDPLLDRQLALLVRGHRAHQIPPARIAEMVRLEKSLENRFNTFRATLAGEKVPDNRLREILQRSDDTAERRAAWEASKQVGREVCEELLELVRLRNRAARELGFPDFYVMSLELDELGDDWLRDTLAAMEEGTRPLFEAYKRDLDARLARRFGVSPDQLRPWHYADPFFQEAPAPGVELDRWFANASIEDLTRRFFGAIGFEVEDLLARADLYEKPGKCQHAFCLAVDRGDDIRVLCNLRPNEYSMGTMLHEFGHAVYDQHVDRSLPWLLRGPAHTLTTEASAMLFGRLSKNAAWLARWAGMPAAEAQAAGEAMRAAIRGQLLVTTRWILVMTAMERELYRDPEQDLDALWWDLVERFQRVPRPAGRREPDWASKIHFSVAPVYYHNYLLGEMMATQLQRHLLREVAGGGGGAWDRFVTSPAVGAWLKERLYAPGRRLDWQGTLRAATGEPLGTRPMVDELAGRD